MEFPTTEGWIDVRDGLPDCRETVIVQLGGAWITEGWVVDDGIWVVLTEMIWTSHKDFEVIAWRPKARKITREELDAAREARLKAEGAMAGLLGVG